MQRFASLLLSGLLVALAGPALRGVEPIPESAQAGLALKMLEGYHGPGPEKAPKRLYVVYFTPADRDPEPRYRERLEPIVEDIRSFYRDNMERLGFGPITFPLVRDASGKLVIHLIKGKEPESAFPRWVGRNGGNTGAPAGGDIARRECQTALKAAGISLDHETVLMFCNLAFWDEKAKTFRHHSPYFGLCPERRQLGPVARADAFPGTAAIALPALVFGTKMLLANKPECHFEPCPTILYHPFE